MKINNFLSAIAFCIFSINSFLVLSPVLAQPKKLDNLRKTDYFKGKEVVAGQVLVKFRNAVARQKLNEIEQNIDVSVKKKVGRSEIYLLNSDRKGTSALIEEISRLEDILYVEPNYIIKPAAIPNDAQFSDMWGLRNIGQAVGGSLPGIAGADINAVSAWEISTGSRNTVVAVIDTGIDHNHSDLAANIWSAPAPFTVTIGGQTIRCEAGTHGFNAITRTCDNTLDEYDHGTHVAGIIGASGNNGIGGVGVNWTASIMSIKFIDATGSGTLSDAIDAIEFAIQAKRALGSSANIRVLSNSWGWAGEASKALLDEINRANENDMLFVAGAGNGGGDRISDNNDINPFYPASYSASNVISVAATDNKDDLVSFSNYGANTVHLGAPGVLIYSTVMDNKYDYWSGTSMATPQVSGAAALILSRCTLPTNILKDTLLNSVDSIPSLNGITATGGRLNVNKAIRSCAINIPPTVSISSPAAGNIFAAPANITISADAVDSDGSVSKVDFYAGNQLIGTTSKTPYQIVWNSAPSGSHSITAVATDNLNVTTISNPVNILVNQAPIANTGGSYNASTNQIIQFNGSSSSDADGMIVSYQWSFGDGNTGMGATPTHIYPQAGTYTVTLTVMDNNGAVNTSKTSANITLPLQAPSNLVGEAKANEVALRWNDNSANEQFFKIERSSNISTGFVVIATVGANTTTYSDKTIQRKQVYYYRVQAGSGSGSSAFSNTVSVRTK